MRAFPIFSLSIGDLKIISIMKTIECDMYKVKVCENYKGLKEAYYYATVYTRIRLIRCYFSDVFVLKN